MLALLLGLGCRPEPVRSPLSFPVPSPSLSPAERGYLERLGPVAFCVDSDWEPYEKVDEDGEYRGIAADLVRLIAARSGVQLELLRTKDWEESLEASKTGRCLVLAFLNETPERDRWLSFTDPYFRDPNVFITRVEHDFIADPARLSGESIALPAGTSVEEQLRLRYPNLRFIVVGTEGEALRMVDEGKADMTLRSLTMAAFVIRKEGLFNLRISGQLRDLENDFRIGVVRSEPMLREILNKGVHSITPLEVQAIMNSHIAIEAKTTVDFRLLYWMLGGFALLAFVWIFWSLTLRRHMRHLRLIIDTVPAYIFVKDLKGRYLLANRWMATAFGEPSEKVKGLTDRDCNASEADIKTWIEQDREVFSSGREFRIDDHPGRRVDGSPGWFQTIKVPYTRPGSRSKAILGVTIDVTDLKNAELELARREQRFRYQAQHDGLTDLPNRALFSDRLGQALALCRREGIKLALVFMDLDHFKEVNDSLGHEAGDLLLKEVAGRLRASMRSSDSAGRIGGDEFVLFFLGVEGKEAALQACEKVRAAIERPFILLGQEARISASLGVSVFPDDGEDEAILSRRSDAAMYRSKALGRNHVCLYDSAIDGEPGPPRD